MDHPHRICVRLLPGVYGMEDLKAGAKLTDAKRKLRPHFDRGLRCCVLFDDYAIYLETDGTVVRGPLPYGGFQIDLRQMRNK